MILKVARLGHPAVRGGGEPVPPADVRGAGFQQFLDDMVDTMREYQGVGLAANQVHAALKAVVLEVREEASRQRSVEAVPLTFLVNPEIVSRSEEMEVGWEGCLSVPGLRGRVPRHRKVTVEALDRDGAPVVIAAEGYLARILQHECDHLEGKVYLDRMDGFASLGFVEEIERHGTNG
ncbi:MAG: peptide deformylase [Elusimicrobia bacterium]|nr:peptide deformylase [Elusimicrobiota bacterium]